MNNKDLQYYAGLTYHRYRSSTLSNMVLPSAAQLARTQVCPDVSFNTSSVTVALGWKTMHPTLHVWPLRVRNKAQSGTDHNLHKPDHDAVARIFEFGLNSQ